MSRKLALVCTCLVAWAAVSVAEPIRPLLTKENRFPELGKVDVGFRFNLVELENDSGVFSSIQTNLESYTPFVRYRPLPDLTLLAAVPFVVSDPDEGHGDSGLGDITLGMELLVFQDIFDYPWVIPHAAIDLDTADDGLGHDENVVTVGIAVGTVVEDVVHFIADARYEIYQDSENLASIAGSIIWDVSDRFAIMGELKLTDDDNGDNNEPVLFLGGFTYEATEDLTFIARGGAGNNTREDTLVSLEADYEL